MTEKQEKKLEINTTRHFTSWLAEQRISLAFTTYQTGKLFLLGINPDGRLSVFERSFERCMGLYATPDARTLYMSSIYQLWRFEMTSNQGQAYAGYDALYLPRMSYVTGDLDIHDIVLTGDNNLVFANTLFSCLATVSEKHNFIPLWTPPYITKLAAEDRCHLNGLALRDGKPRYVTSVSRSDINAGWREHRADGGIVMDIDSGEVVVDRLSMPHSPRWHNNKLWLLNSGTGYFGYVDMEKGKFEPVTFCPGYLRGMCFSGDYAVVGLSQPRENKTFTGLALQDTLEEKKAQPRCAIQVINLNTGDVTHSANIEGIVSELYDVVVLPGVARPMAIGFKSDEIKHVISVG